MIHRSAIPPQLVVSLSNQDATRDTYQRKVFFDGHNFFIVYFDSTSKQLKYVASQNGQTWCSPVMLFTFSVAPYYGGNVDLQYPNRRVIDLITGKAFDFLLAFSGSNGTTWSTYSFQISGQTLVNVYGYGYTPGGQGGSAVANLDGINNVWIHHASSYLVAGEWASVNATSSAVSYGGTSTGGCQILPYKTANPFNLFVLAKDASNILYYSRINANGSSFLDAFPSIATLTTSFSDFCGCSEAQALGAPARVHMVYIKSTGDLCYRNYQNDTLSAETLLVAAASSPSYPVIAADRYGSLYVFYVQAGAIMLLMWTSGAWRTPITLFPGHAYSNPVYLSCNQYAQNGRICLVWMEGTSPYQLWFAAIPEGY